MRNIIFCLIMLVPLRGTSQQTTIDAFVGSAIQTPASVPVGDEAKIEIQLGNTSGNIIPANTILATISWDASFYEYVGVDPSSQSGYTVLSSGTNTVTFKNTNRPIQASISQVDVLAIKVKAKAITTNPSPFQGAVAVYWEAVANVFDNNDTNNSVSGSHSVSAASPSPVDYLSFEVDAKNLDAHLAWTTASEYNNSHFEVQKSVDGQEWETIGKVDGNGTSRTSVDYNFLDKFAGRYNSLVYYRLNQYDYNGNSKLSELRRVKFEDVKRHFNAYPNPFIDNLTIENSDIKRAKYRIIDSNGSLLMRGKLGSGVNSIDTEELNAGVYNLVIIDANNNVLNEQKIIKVQ